MYQRELRLWPWLHLYIKILFALLASGPKQCYVCLEHDEASCSKMQETQICATDPYSLGTSHCGTAVGKYRDSKGNIMDAFVRGCINCAGRKMLQ